MWCRDWRQPHAGEYIVLGIRRSVGVASTVDGRFFVRVGDTCRPVVGDDVLRLADERPNFPWETMTSLRVPRTNADASKCEHWAAAIRDSDRVKASVKEKTNDELLEHYELAKDGVLTNLGVLLLGSRTDRARLGTAPVVQAIKYDERGEKVAKSVWDDYALSPMELVDAIWQELPDFRESYELPEGLFRSRIPAYEESVVRELVVNALVHRPYTQRGDIFLNLHPDRLEVVNPGRLPFGVTPANILHASRRRNDGLARVFHDLKLMEREGSGFDLMYDRLLSSGRAAPTVTEGADSVHVVVQRRVIHPGVVRLIAEADQRHQLTQRQRIALGLLGQSEGMSAAELADALELPDPVALRPWLSRLLELGLVERTGRTRAPAISSIRSASQCRIGQLHHVEADPAASPGGSHRRRREQVPCVLGFGDPRPDRPRDSGATFRRALRALVDRKEISAEGERRWRRYHPIAAIDGNDEPGR